MQKPKTLLKPSKGSAIKARKHSSSPRQPANQAPSGKVEKAYKLLAMQEGISNQLAKSYCDKGLVYIGDRKLKIARAFVPKHTKFKLMAQAPIVTIFEDEDILVLNKPAFMTSDECVKNPKHKLLHRLDKETSGILILCKNEDFRQKAIKAFKDQQVYKEYEAIVFGVVKEEGEVDLPLETTKNAHQAKTKISLTKGKSAYTHYTPLEILGKKTKLKVVIKTGRTHQIRVHLQHAGYPVVGDELYGDPSRARRMMLHAKAIKLLHYAFEIEAGDDFVF